MKKPFFKKSQPRGFRFSVRDACFILIVICAAIFVYVRTQDYTAALVPVHLCSVFFLFCNVFRVRTRHELAWVGSYLAAVAIALSLSDMFWPIVIGITTPTLAAVTIWAWFDDGYRGVFSR